MTRFPWQKEKMHGKGKCALHFADAKRAFPRRRSEKGAPAYRNGAKIYNSDGGGELFLFLSKRLLYQRGRTFRKQKSPQTEPPQTESPQTEPPQTEVSRRQRLFADRGSLWQKLFANRHRLFAGKGSPADRRKQSLKNKNGVGDFKRADNCAERKGQTLAGAALPRTVFPAPMGRRILKNFAAERRSKPAASMQYSRTSPAL